MVDVALPSRRQLRRLIPGGIGRRELRMDDSSSVGNQTAFENLIGEIEPEGLGSGIPKMSDPRRVIRGEHLRGMMRHGVFE